MIKTIQWSWNSKLELINKSKEFEHNNAQIAFVFVDRTQLNNDLIQEVKNELPNATVVYGSTSGHFSNNEVFFDVPIITGIEFEKTTIKTIEVESEFLNNQDHISHKSVKELFKTTNLKAILVFSEGTKTNGSELTSCLKNYNLNNVPVFGGLTADMERFEKTFAGINEFEETPKVVLIGLIGDDVSFNFGVEGGWQVFGPERTITDSHKNTLFELNNENALDLYKKYLGEYAAMLPASSLYFPLSVKYADETNYVVRTVLNIDEKNKSMTFAGNVPKGGVVRFMKSNTDYLLDATQEALNKSTKDIETPQVLFLVSCVGRKLVLGNRFDEELAIALKKHEKAEIKPTILGFYSYGEIAPDSTFSKCDLHNQTITIMSIYEK